MKKRKLLALLSVLVLAAMLLSSCGLAKKFQTISSFEKVMNPEYDFSADVLTKSNALTELGGFAIADQTDEFALFVKTEAGENADETATFKVFSFRTGTVILTMSNTSDVTYEVVLTEAPLLFVNKTLNGEKSYLAYDAAGFEVMNAKYAPTEPSEFADLILFENAVYSVEDNGKMTKKVDVPEYLALGAPDLWNDEYFYFFTDDGTESVQIFDRSFNFVSSWHAPASAEGLNGFVLDSGDVIVQYSIELDNHAEKYDYYVANEGEVAKYDLVTEVIAAKNGKAKELKKFEYRLDLVISAYECKEFSEENNVDINEKVKNIAWIAPIVDQRIDDSTAALDVVLMDNKGNVGKSIKLVDDQAASMPVLVRKGVYSVNTLYGTVLADAKGRVLRTIYNDEMEIVGGYLVGGSTAIYDLGMNKVYDLRENQATVLCVIGDSVIIQKGASIEESYDVIMLRGGEETKLCSFSAINDSTAFIAIEGADCYALYNTSSGEYVYYNAAGKELLRSYALLECIGTSSESGAALLCGLEDEKPVYFAFAE